MDGVPHAMQPANGTAAACGARWCEYDAVLGLPPTRLGDAGAHGYYFVARASDKAARLPAEGALDGPLVLSAPGAAGKVPAPGLGFALGALAAVALAWARRRRE